MFFLIPCLDNEIMESSWNPAQVLEGVSPSLWLRADQGVYTGGARQFYSPDKGQLAIADNAALSVTTQDFTIGIWAYLDSTSLSWIVSKGGGGAAGYSIYAASGAVYAEIKTAAGSNILITGPAISTSAWHFITAEFDRDGNGTIYVDNVAGTPISISANSGSIDVAGAFSLGAYHLNTFNFAGRLSRAFKLDRLLTTAERTWLYNSGNGRVYGELGVAATDGSALLTSLSAYWNLNETSGTANAIDQHSTNDLTPTFAEIVTNGSFASDTGWTKEANWTISAGVAHSDGTQTGNAQIYQAQVYDSHRYSATFTVSGYSAGTVGAYLGGVLGTPRSANGTYVETITSGSTDFTSLLGDADFVGDIDNFSVVAVDIPAADGPANSTGVVDGDPVVMWQSLEGSAHQFLQSTASKRPLYRSSAINSQPGIDADGVDDLLVKASAFLTGTAGTVVIVYRLDAVPNTYQVLLCSADEALATKRLALLGRGNTANPHLGIDWQNAGTADLLDGSTTVNVDTDYGGLFQSNGTTATAKLNGTAQTLNADTGANSGNWWDDATAKDNVSVGAQKDSAGESRFTTGKICEIYVHPANLTTGLTQLAAYILARYGVTL